MLEFDRAVKEQYPGTTFGIMVMRGVTIESADGLENEKRELEAFLQEQFSGVDKRQMREVAPFSEYHTFYKTFKKTYHVLHQCESIATGKKQLPDGAPLVQAMFMAEVQHQLLTAGYDISRLGSDYTVRLGDGETEFEGIGKTIRKPPNSDIVFTNGETILGSIICGPDHEHRIQQNTEDVLFAIYGVPGISKGQMENHFASVLRYVQLISPESKVDLMQIQ
ncbi:MAG: hypothetical protein MJE63_01060 [Proteobacteria bacterium]|nr:hypothetical protein [Pseudomonadota bacterium]